LLLLQADETIRKHHRLCPFVEATFAAPNLQFWIIAEDLDGQYLTWSWFWSFLISLCAKLLVAFLELISLNGGFTFIFVNGVFEVDAEFALHHYSEKSAFSWNGNMMRIGNSPLILRIRFRKLKFLTWSPGFPHLFELSHSESLTCRSVILDLPKICVLFPKSDRWNSIFRLSSRYWFCKLDGPVIDAIKVPKYHHDREVPACLVNGERYHQATLSYVTDAGMDL